jgi:hypothetical protein
MFEKFYFEVNDISIMTAINLGKNSSEIGIV